MAYMNVGGRKSQIVDEFERAVQNYKRIQATLDKSRMMHEEDNISPEAEFIMENILPDLPEFKIVKEVVKGNETVKEYRSRYGNDDSMFRSRADYERTLRYLKRFNKAAESEWSSDDTYQLWYAADQISTQLTSVRMVDGSLQSEFMRRETALAIRNTNKKIIDSLKERGINVVKQPVYQLDEETGVLSQMYSKSRHPVFIYGIETPEQERQYYYTIQREPSMQIIQPAVPDNGIVDKWGDAVAVEKHEPRTMNSKSILSTLNQDEQDYDRAELYLRNFKNTIDAVLPPNMSEKFDEVFDDMLGASPDDMRDMVDDLIGNGGDEINALEFWYSDAATSAGVKLYQVVESLKKTMENADIDKEYELYNMGNPSNIEEALKDNPLASAQNVYASYQQAKKEGNVNSTTLRAIRESRG